MIGWISDQGVVQRVDLRGNSIPILVARSVALVAKSVMPAIGAAMRVPAAARAMRRFLSLVRLRSASGFLSSSSTTSRSIVSSSWISFGKVAVVWRREVMICRSSAVLALKVCYLWD